MIYRAETKRQRLAFLEKELPRIEKMAADGVVEYGGAPISDEIERLSASAKRLKRSVR